MRRLRELCVDAVTDAHGRAYREMQRTFFDGLNFDYEVPMQLGSQDALLYSRLVGLTAQRLHALGAHYQVSVDVPWSPYDIDGRNYDWLGIAEHVDLLFVMAYDTQSQIWGRCSASANSPPALVERGVRQWLDLGVPPSKIVLGLPWYAYMYECQPDATGRAPAPDVDGCMLRPVPFQGATCSDAAGAQSDYSFFADMLRAGRNSTPVMWDPALRAHRFNFVGDPRASATRAGDRTAGEHVQGSSSNSSSSSSSSSVESERTGQQVLEQRAAAAAATAAGAGAGAGAEATAGQRSDVTPLVRFVSRRSLAAKAKHRDALGRDAGGHDLQADAKPSPDTVYQVWFDPPDSMREKYAIAKSLGLRGIGFWHLEALAHGSSDPLVAAETADHWAAVAEFLAD